LWWWTVKHERSIPEQEAKMKRGVKRDCTEGTSCDYVHHAGNTTLGTESNSHSLAALRTKDARNFLSC